MALPLRRSGASGIDLLRDRFHAVWSRSDEIFEILPKGELLAQPIVWRHPFIFYVGHLPAFSFNQICGGVLHWPSFNSYFDDLFCRGIDPDVDTGECHWHPEVPERWPSIAETFVYRDQVRGAILESVEALGYCGSDDIMARGGRVLQMVLEHEYMHQETLLYMMQQLTMGQKIRPRTPVKYLFQPRRVSDSVGIPKGRARLGARFDELSFGWDNEFEQIVVEVPSFTIDSLPVTNGQFEEFVRSGGYNDARYWRPEDWRWKKMENKCHPTCWIEQPDGWFYRTMFDVFPLARVECWPVYVSLAEARAYAAWRGKRLPTEAEYQRAAFYGPDEGETQYPWGDDAPDRQHGNFDFASWSPAPVGSSPAGASRWCVHELVGNGWELTDSPFGPLPGFTAYMPNYPDYSKDFFDGKHFVIKGASWATDAELLRPSFRNWYQAHYPYVFAKFRCVSD